MTHIPVLLQQTLKHLALTPGERFLDATIGSGGHAKAAAAVLGPKGLIIGLDADAESIARATQTLEIVSTPHLLFQSNFRQLTEAVSKAQVESVDAILFDLGWSSDQMVSSGRGFSFQQDEPLLMTLNNQVAPSDVTAAVIVNEWSEETLVTILIGFGEERFAKAIAAGIVAARATKPIKTTFDLVKIINDSVPAWYRHRRINPATKTFQALRIATNDELGALSEALTAAWQSLAPGGRLAVISFHSLEARLVKDYFQQLVASGEGKISTKPVEKASREESLANPRSRSAQLRVIKKII
jgi:16S rRNA (cytosine1402-N4)-methyltransferase